MTQYVGEKLVALVPSVETDLISQETPADSKAKRGDRHLVASCFPSVR
jgi:hypothetical protein